MELLDIKSPYDNKSLGSLPLLEEKAAFEMLDVAYNAFNNKKSWLKPFERIAILNKLAALVTDEQDWFSHQIAAEGGKPLVDAKVEVSRAINGIKLAAEELITLLPGKEIPMGFSASSSKHMAFTTNEPLGVVLAFSAFNHPLNLLVHQITPAIAVGCPVIIKPASKTPFCCKKFVELVHKAGLNKEWCQFLFCKSSIAEKLVSSNKISFFSFIGSAKVGWYLQKKLAPGAKYAFEHGGAAPVVVDKNNISIDDIASSIVKGGFYHAGQVCISTQRVFIHEDIIDSLSKLIVDKVTKLKVGDPLLPDTEVGPIISNSELKRVDNLVKEAQNEGADILCGGSAISESLYSPTVLLNPSLKSKVSNIEIFGPVICLYKYTSLENVVQNINCIGLPFQAAVFSNSLDNIMYLYKNIDASTIVVNDSSAFRVDWMPFTGRKTTAFGISGIPYAMHELLQHKMVVIKNINL